MMQNERGLTGRPALVDRSVEIAELRDLADSHQKRLAILYGRRQVGKTHLLRHAWGDRRMFYFLAASLTQDLNRLDLLRELATWHGHSYPPEDYPTWRTVFRALIKLADAGPIVIILDEFQYLLGGIDVTSQLVAVWDLVPPATPITVALSGSAVSTMAHLSAGSEPLYGRINWGYQLRPFDYRDAALMMPDYPPRVAASLYGIYGGMPRYLAALNPTEGLIEGTIRTFISSQGEVHLQMQSLIEQIQGIRDVADYRSVLTVVAEKPSLRDIVTRTGLDELAVRRKLEVLENLGLVYRERNFGASAKTAHRYHVADNAVRFWHRFITPERTALTEIGPSEFWSTKVAPSFDTYLGSVFESIVRQGFARDHARWGLPSVEIWGRWEGQDRDRQSVELDIVGRLVDGRLLAGEVKWSSAPYGPSLHAIVIGKLERLAQSGQGWAKDSPSAAFLYASAAGFTAEMRELAASIPAIHLVTLEDLYPRDVGT
jgi:uncharacterized protein